MQGDKSYTVGWTDSSGYECTWTRRIRALYTTYTRNDCWCTLGSFRCLLSWEKERKRLGIMDVQYLKQMQTTDEQAATVEAAVHKRPKLLWINFY